MAERQNDIEIERKRKPSFVIQQQEGADGQKRQPETKSGFGKFINWAANLCGGDSKPREEQAKKDANAGTQMIKDEPGKAARASQTNEALLRVKAEREAELRQQEANAKK